MSSSSSSQSSPCAACKFLRRKCTAECVFAPYFPPDQPAKFASVHRVFGASNVAKLLNEIPAAQRDDAANSLAYEAEARFNDPVYGCVGFISQLQHRLKQLHLDLHLARQELDKYIGPQSLLVPSPNFGVPGNPSSSTLMIPPQPTSPSCSTRSPPPSATTPPIPSRTRQRPASTTRSTAASASSPSSSTASSSSTWISTSPGRSSTNTSALNPCSSPPQISASPETPLLRPS
ncbi:unnamed protein product [Linum tenue]|uniref:LOB domain-containing protein n=1 Tax=Linum tenue TaxID=586396 RepID=A0AAV0GQY5_9ROSI|nr:unnamed protein product [Linum tenue]